MAKYILPVLIIALLVTALIKKISIYNSFVDGIKESLRLILSIAPYLIAMLILLEIFEISGLNKIFERILAPILTAFGIPSELASLVIIRPLSGNGSIAILERIIETYGADSYVAKCASIIVGASETVFYVATVYFSTTKVVKLRYTLPVALFSSFVGVIISCLLARMI